MVVLITIGDQCRGLKLIELHFVSFVTPVPIVNSIPLSAQTQITYIACNSAHAHAGPAPAITRLGIAPYQWGTECLSGDVIAGNATSFPMPIGMVYNNIIIVLIIVQQITR